MILLSKRHKKETIKSAASIAVRSEQNSLVACSQCAEWSVEVGTFIEHEDNWFSEDTLGFDPPSVNGAGGYVTNGYGNPVLPDHGFIFKGEVPEAWVVGTGGRRSGIDIPQRYHIAILQRTKIKVGFLVTHRSVLRFDQSGNCAVFHGEDVQGC